MHKSMLDRFLPIALEPDWRTRADDCLIYGSSIAGAHKYYLATPLVRYRLHEGNHWYGKVPSEHDAMMRRYRKNRLIGFLASHMGYDRSALIDHAVREFESAAAGAELRNLRRYRRAIRNSSRTLCSRLSARFKLERVAHRLRRNPSR